MFKFTLSINHLKNSKDYPSYSQTKFNTQWWCYWMTCSVPKIFTTEKSSNLSFQRSETQQVLRIFLFIKWESINSLCYSHIHLLFSFKHEREICRGGKRLKTPQLRHLLRVLWLFQLLNQTANKVLSLPFFLFFVLLFYCWLVMFVHQKMLLSKSINTDEWSCTWVAAIWVLFWNLWHSVNPALIVPGPLVRTTLRAGACRGPGS